MAASRKKQAEEAAWKILASEDLDGAGSDNNEELSSADQEDEEEEEEEAALEPEPESGSDPLPPPPVVRNNQIKQKVAAAVSVADSHHDGSTITKVKDKAIKKKDDDSPPLVAPKKKERKPLDPTWWIRYVSRLARIWQPRSVDSWCGTLEPDPPTPYLLYSKQVAEGMIYIKMYKASSSTCEGIALSIAHHVGRRQRQKHALAGQQQRQRQQATPAVCIAYTRHEFANNRMHARRHPSKSLLWTFVRNPAARDLSHIYHFEIGRNHRTGMTSSDILKHIQTNIKGRQTRYLVPAKTSPAPLWPVHELKKNRTEVVMYMKDEIFVNYDFIGLTERMTESLAVMVLLWDLQPEDVIVLNSKRSGGFDDGGGHNHTCTVIPKAVMTPELEEYFEYRHSLWNADVLLYHAANASLEMTIDSLGRDRVQNMAQTIERLQNIAQEKCLDEAKFPCSPDGVYQPKLAEQSCYVQDAGCGHECVDRVLSTSS